MKAYQTIEFEVNDDNGIVWLNRPKIHNAFRYFILSLLLILTCTTNAQQWSEPVVISSSLNGLNVYPDFVIDKNNILHVVWEYEVEIGYRKIYYSKSTDYGETWSEPEDISQNTEKWLSEPQIVSDSHCHLYVSYTYNSINPSAEQILLQKFDGVSWSDADTVSGGYYGCRHTRLVINNTDKVYCFWYRGINEGTIYYRCIENGFWGEIVIPFNNNDLFFLGKAVVDAENAIHCSVYHHYEWQNYSDTKIVYLKYSNGYWGDIEQVSYGLPWDGNDITVDTANLPHIVWRQPTISNPQTLDGTIHSYYDGATWSNPEIIVEDPSHQAIVIDNLNGKHIFNNEKYEEGYRLIHYQKLRNEWVGNVVNENQNGFGIINPIVLNNFLYLVYYWLDGSSGSNFFSKILFQKSTISTGIDSSNPDFTNMNSYPNPFDGKISITFKLYTDSFIELKIYTIGSKLLRTVVSKSFSVGYYEFTWDGRDEKGAEVPPGVYLIRLQSKPSDKTAIAKRGQNIMTKSIIKK